jgi:hypothetical protein
VLLGAALVLCLAAPASSSVRIKSDKGGQIGAYVARYSKLKRSGERVVIDGPCLSACTIVVGMIPAPRLCATPNAVLGFHAAWMPADDGRKVTSPEATRLLMQLYPASVRQWITRRGGLTPKLMLMQGRDLAAVVPPCGEDSTAGRIEPVKRAGRFTGAAQAR